MLYLPSLWWHFTLNIGEAFGLGYKASDFSFTELERVKDVSSYAQDLCVLWVGVFLLGVASVGRSNRRRCVWFLAGYGAPSLVCCGDAGVCHAIGSPTKFSIDLCAVLCLIDSLLRVRARGLCCVGNPSPRPRR